MFLRFFGYRITFLRGTLVQNNFEIINLVNVVKNRNLKTHQKNYAYIIFKINFTSVWSLYFNKIHQNQEHYF